MKKTAFIFASLLALSSCAGPVTMSPQASRSEIIEETQKQRELVYQKYISEQMRIQSISFPILAANADFCGQKTAPMLGMTGWSQNTVAPNYRQAAANLYGLDDRLFVQAVVKNSPAAKAGIRAGDVILAVNGQEIPQGTNGMKTAAQLFDRAGYDTSTIAIDRNGAPINTRIQPIAGCDYPVVLDYDSQAINAYADGSKIVISKGIIKFAENDNEIAMVIAHELGHSAMNHVNKLQQNAMAGSLGGLAIDMLASAAGASTGGQFSQIGAGIAAQRYSVPFEQEADYVGLYFMKRAGYNVNGVADFWRRMGAEGESSISIRTSHPTSPERFLAIDRTAAEINQKASHGQPLVPNFAQRR